MKYELSENQVKNLIVFMNLGLKHKPDLQGTDALVYAELYNILSKPIDEPKEEVKE